LAKSADGYPPYNIERATAGKGEVFVISVAVAGFAPDELGVVIEDSQLHVRGRAEAQAGREFLHRGIATRQFQRTFLLAEGMEVNAAELSDGLLKITITRPEPAHITRRIEIKVAG
jgi:HSP20 family molecular chaperone IbpA